MLLLLNSGKTIRVASPSWLSTVCIFSLTVKMLTILLHGTNCSGCYRSWHQVARKLLVIMKL